MTNQEIFNTLSGLECVLFYKADGSDNPEGVKTSDLWEMDKALRDLIQKWHDLTGCTLKD
jgi:hypothetical protein